MGRTIQIPILCPERNTRLGNTNPDVFIVNFDMKSRNWVLTVNNPGPWSEIEFPTNVAYCVGQLELGESGTPHWQLVLKFKHPVRLRQVKSIFPTCHAEVRQGSEQQALQYVYKDDTRIQRLSPYGISQDQVDSLLTSSNRSRSNSNLDSIKQKLDSGETEAEIADEYFGDWVRHYRALRAYLLLKSIPRSLSDAPTVIVAYGPTGTGKSRYAITQYPRAYWKQRSIWWDGYSSQEVIVLDEYYGWLPFDTILRLCDRYPLLLETKGGQVQCNANTIVFTSNTLPDKWYRNVYFPSFERRVTKWIYFGNLAVIQSTTYNNFLNLIPPVEQVHPEAQG